MFIPDGVCLGTNTRSEMCTHLKTQTLHLILYLLVNAHCSQALFQNTPTGRRKYFLYIYIKTSFQHQDTSSEQGTGPGSRHFPKHMVPRPGLLILSTFPFLQHRFFSSAVMPLNVPPAIQLKDGSPEVEDGKSIVENPSKALSSVLENLASPVEARTQVS